MWTLRRLAYTNSIVDVPFLTLKRCDETRAELLTRNGCDAVFFLIAINCSRVSVSVVDDDRSEKLKWDSIFLVFWWVIGRCRRRRQHADRERGEIALKTKKWKTTDNNKRCLKLQSDVNNFRVYGWNYIHCLGPIFVECDIGWHIQFEWNGGEAKGDEDVDMLIFWRLVIDLNEFYTVSVFCAVVIAHDSSGPFCHMTMMNRWRVAVDTRQWTGRAQIEQKKREYKTIKYEWVDLNIIKRDFLFVSFIVPPLRRLLPVSQT